MRTAARLARDDIRVFARTLALVLAVGLVPLGLGATLLVGDGRAQARADLDHTLVRAVDTEALVLETYFSRARAVILLTAQNPAFRAFYEAPGTTQAKLDAGGRAVADSREALAYLERLYPSSIGEACLIDASGREVARVVRGVHAHRHDLSPNEGANAFFGRTRALPPGLVHQARPYVSPDTHEWVISNSTPLPPIRGRSPAIVHFEVTIESFRREAAAGAAESVIHVVDGHDGGIVFSSDRAQHGSVELGRARDRTFAGVLGRRSGVADVGGRRVAFRRLAPTDGNANDWYVVATAGAAPSPVLSSGSLALLAVMVAILLVLGVALARRDVLARRHGRESEWRALHDALTGLPNRTLLRDRLETAILGARRSGLAMAVLLIDLDRFKDINDTLGHHAGDELLRELSVRLRSVLRESETIARLGGDEFAVVLPALLEPPAALAAARRVKGALEQPVLIGGLPISVEASIGIAIYPDHAEGAEALLQRADVAMYAAKSLSSGCEVYDPAADDNTTGRLTLVGELRQAIERSEIVLHYQPKADVASGAIVGVEALVRWRHPSRGLLGADQFIPIAQHTGLMRPLTLHILEEALRQARAWQDAGLELGVAVNLSARNLIDLDLPADVGARLGSTGVDARWLTLEITESTIMSDPVRANEVLLRLADMGVTLAVDDFGTGYSSLSYLRRLPVHELKVDRSFVATMAEEASDAEIVRATVDLGHTIGLTVVAEGVESEAVLQTLSALSCDTVQGYILTPPLPGQALERWVRAWDPRRLAQERRAA